MPQTGSSSSCVAISAGGAASRCPAARSRTSSARIATAISSCAILPRSSPAGARCECVLEGVLVVVALRRDDDERALGDPGVLEVERRQHAAGVGVVAL